ncbi:hypothetical protein E3P77_00015 [Wallemia ichthyophaga]|nr:hypothetical protein E3P77_00015 [Wallemia ichthyophaga]
MNHPNKRPKALRASRYPLPAIPSVDFRLPSSSAVDTYLHDIQGEYDEFIDNVEKSSASTSAQPETELPTLEEVPRLFFKQDFDLGDPSTFDAVTKSIGDSVGLDNLDSPEDIGINEILHARLEHHANAVDKILVHELTERAPSLFSALDNLHHFGDYAKDAMDKFVDLKESLEEISNNKLQIKFDTINGIVKGQEVEDLLTVICDIENINHALLALQQMTELGHYFDALELVENISKTVVENIRSKDVDNVLKIESDTDFTSLSVFANVASDLHKHTNAILEYISKDLTELLFIDYIKSLKSSDHNHSDLSKDVEQSICVLDRADMLRSSLQSYENKLLRHVLQFFFELLPADIQSKPLDLEVNFNGSLYASQFAKELRQMQQIEYCRYLNKCREHLHIINSSIVGQKEVLEGISQNETITTKLSSLSGQIMELLYSELASLIRLRKDIEAELPLSEYLQFDHVVWKLITASNQLQEFLELFHANYTTQSAKLVEMEVWSQAEVTPLVQKVINTIVRSAVEDIPELLQTTPIITEGDENHENQINVEGLKFYTVEALNKVLVLLIDYLRIMLQVPNSATEIMTRMIEVLKQFNSRTCQVVLGAGAMKSAGLKNITAKHLALASQSLSVMISLIPYIREAVRRQLKSNQATLLIEFDRLRRDYQEHQYEIHAKLVSILGDRLTAHSKSLAATKFDKTKEEDIKKPNSYAEGLVKETATLHRVLNKYLPEATVKFVFKQVFDAINKRIGDYYQRLTVKTELGKEKLLTDAHFLCNRLNALQGTDELGSSLISVAESRQVSKTPTESPRPSIATENDTAERRSLSFDVQSRNTTELHRMTIGAVNQDIIPQIDEGTEQKRVTENQQADADKSLPEVPQEMLQSGSQEVKSSGDEDKANQNQETVDVQQWEGVDGLENKDLGLQENKVNCQSIIEEEVRHQEYQPDQPEKNHSEVMIQAQGDAQRENEQAVIDDGEKRQSTEKPTDNADKPPSSQHINQTEEEAGNKEHIEDKDLISGEKECDTYAIKPGETEESAAFTPSSAVKSEAEKFANEKLEDTAVDSETTEGKSDKHIDQEEHHRTEADGEKVDKNQDASHVNNEILPVANLDEDHKSDSDVNAKKSDQVTEVGAKSDKQEKSEREGVEKTDTSESAQLQPKETAVENSNQKIPNNIQWVFFAKLRRVQSYQSQQLSFNAPLIKQLYFIRVTTNIDMFDARIELGTLGYCVYLEDGKSCIEPTLGYTIDLEEVGLGEFLQLSQVQDFMNSIPDDVINWVTYVFVLHFISLGLSFFTVLVGIFSHIRELGRSYWSSLISILACVVALITFAFDMAFAVKTRNRLNDTNVATAQIGQSVWLVLAAAIVLVISVFMFLAGIAMSRRQHKTRDLFDNEKVNSDSHQHNQNDTYGMGERRKLNKQDRDKPDDSSSASFSPLPGSYTSDQQPLTPNAGRPYESNHWDDTRSTVHNSQGYGQTPQMQHLQPHMQPQIQPHMQSQMYQNQGQPQLDSGRPTSPFEQQMMTQPMLAPYMPQPSISPLPFARSPQPSVSYVSSPPPSSMSPPPMPYARSPPPQMATNQMFAAPQMSWYYNPAAQGGQYGQLAPSEISNDQSGGSYWPNPNGLVPNHGNNARQFHMTNNVAQQAAAGALSTYQANPNEEKGSEEKNDTLTSPPASSPLTQTSAVPLTARKPKKQQQQQWSAPFIKSPPPPETYAEPEGDPYRSARAMPRRMDNEDSKEPPPYQ